MCLTPVEMWKILGYVGNEWLKALFNKVLIEGKMPKHLRKSFIRKTSISDN